MHLEVSQIQGSGFVEVTARHGDQHIVWPAKAYSKVKLVEPLRVFDEINGYWAWLGKDAQDKVWECYVQIKAILDQIVDNLHIGQAVRFYVNEMYKAMPMDGFKQWLLTVGNMHFPPEIQDRLTEDSRYNKSDQTYLRGDYINLATLGLALRPMLPIWGEYIEQTSDNDMYKEMAAIGLVAETEICTWPDKPDAAQGYLTQAPTSAFDKLHSYVRFCTEDTPVTLGNLWKGMGSAEIPVWLQSKVMVRRLTIVPLCNANSHSIIANIYRYAKSNIKPPDRSTSDRVNEKRPEGGGGDEDEKTSYLESYKIKQRISSGDATTYAVNTRNMAQLAQKVDPTFDMNLLTLTAGRLEEVSRYEVQPHQILIAQWVMAKAFPARAFYHIPREAVVRLLATSQALLWHWGYFDIAVFMQVRLHMTSDQMLPHLTKSTKSGSRISARYKDDLGTMFPHVKLLRRGRADLDAEADSENRAALAINFATAAIRSSTWTYLGPIELHRIAQQPEGHQQLIVPQTIKNTITELVLHLANLNR